MRLASSVKAVSLLCLTVADWLRFSMWGAGLQTSARSSSCAG
ncbi:MAG: hypothetical protein ACKERG_01250 [Candidatus Hodgkinia cicadicola]